MLEVQNRLICEEAEQRGQNAGGTHEVEAGVADVDLKEVGEEVGFALEGRESSGHDGGGAVHQEHGAGHEVREAVEAGVGVLVLGEVFYAEGVGQLEGLAEAQGKTFAGDGVD